MQCTQSNVVAGDRRENRALRRRVRHVRLTASPTAARGTCGLVSPAWSENRVHFNYMSVEQRVYLGVVDAFSKCLDCLHMNNDTTTQALISELTYVFWYTECIISFC